jgi:hypothetical protein
VATISAVTPDKSIDNAMHAPPTAVFRLNVRLAKDVISGIKMTDKQTRSKTIRELIHSQNHRFAFAFIAGLIVNLTLHQDDNSFEAMLTCLIIFFGLPYLVKKEASTQNELP